MAASIARHCSACTGSVMFGMVRLRSQAGQKPVAPSGATSQLQPASAALAQDRHRLPSALARQAPSSGTMVESVRLAGISPSVEPQRMQTLFSKCSSWPQVWQVKTFIGPCSDP